MRILIASFIMSPILSTSSHLFQRKGLEGSVSRFHLPLLFRTMDWAEGLIFSLWLGHFMFMIHTLDGLVMQQIVLVIPRCVWDVLDLMTGWPFRYPPTCMDAYLLWYSLRCSSVELMGSVHMDHSVHNMYVPSRWSIQFCRAFPYLASVLWLFYIQQPPHFLLYVIQIGTLVNWIFSLFENKMPTLRKFHFSKNIFLT